MESACTCFDHATLLQGSRLGDRVLVKIAEIREQSHGLLLSVETSHPFMYITRALSHLGSARKVSILNQISAGLGAYRLRGP